MFSWSGRRGGGGLRCGGAVDDDLARARRGRGALCSPPHPASTRASARRGRHPSGGQGSASLHGSRQPRRVTAVTWIRARSSDVPTRARVDSRRTGRLPIPRPARPGHLRRQGQESAQQAELLLRRPLRARAADPPDGDGGGQRRVDGRHHRGRGASARIQLDQGVRPAVQHPLPRRQVLSGAGGHAQRGVPAADGLPRSAAQGRALLRAVLARLGHPRDARPAHPGVPGPHLLGGSVQAAQSD